MNKYDKDTTYQGTVIFFGTKSKNPDKKKSSTYGFIGVEGFEDIFVHFSDITAEGYRFLKEGQKVSFQVGLNHNGRPKAINVQIIE
jgi:CspA family cold shock protein